MTEFMTRAAIYWIVFMAIWVIKQVMHDETWHSPKVKPIPKIYQPLLFALMSLIPYLRFIFATVAVWNLFVPPKDSQKYEEMKKLHELEYGSLDGKDNSL